MSLDDAERKSEVLIVADLIVASNESAMGRCAKRGD